MLLSYNKIQLKPNELLKPFDYKKCPESNLDNTEIHSLLKAFTDNSIIAKAFKESGVDTEFFNYSMLNKETLLKARGYLMELYKKVQELENIRKINFLKCLLYMSELLFVYKIQTFYPLIIFLHLTFPLIYLNLVPYRIYVPNFHQKEQSPSLRLS